MNRASFEDTKNRVKLVFVVVMMAVLGVIIVSSAVHTFFPPTGTIDPCVAAEDLRWAATSGFVPDQLNEYLVVADEASAQCVN